MFKVCSHFCTVATNVLSIQHCIYTSSCSCHIGTQHSSFQHRTLHRQYHTHATRPSEHQTTQAQTIKTSTTCVMQVGTPLVLQPKQLSSICRIAVVTHQYNIQTRTLESYIIQKWCPPLNYPFILQRQVTKQHSTPHLRQALRTTYLGIGHRLYAQLRRRLMCNTQASQNTQASAPFYQHSLRLHNNMIQPDTLYHTQCNHSVPLQLSDSLLLQLHNNNHNNLWDTPSHSQHKHHLPTLRLHNLHLVTLSTHHITAQPCQVFSHHHTTTQPYPILSSHHHNMDHSSITSLHHTQQARH